jgi:hypothetical protein
MSVVETYRVVTGTTRALLYFERTEEVCEFVAEVILDRRLRAGLRSPPGAARKIASALRDGVRFVEDERGQVVAATSPSETSKALSPKVQGGKKRPRKKPPRRRGR